jgi:uncharacterized damage-inducible protein DinB
MQIRHFLVDTYAHMPPGNLLGDISEPDAMRRVSDNLHSIAEIVAHIEFWQDWFLQRCRGDAAPMAQTAAVGWPAVSKDDWPALRDRFIAGLNAAADLGNDPARLLQPVSPALEFPPLASYTVGDVLIHLATHNSHHFGQIITLRQLMGSWPPASGGWTW